MLKCYNILHEYSLRVVLTGKKGLGSGRISPVVLKVKETSSKVRRFWQYLPEEEKKHPKSRK